MNQALSKDVVTIDQKLDASDIFNFYLYLNNQIYEKDQTMKQLLHIDFHLKDQAGVDTLIDFMTSSREDMLAEGYKEIDHYVNQDNPLHLVYVVRWTSRDHYDKAMEKMFANQEIATMLNAVLTEPATSTFLDKME